jgi:dGTP triphosphohydrolase
VRQIGARHASVEACALADDIAYNNHDVDDGYAPACLPASLPVPPPAARLRGAQPIQALKEPARSTTTRRLIPR